MNSIYIGDGASHLSHLSYCGNTPGVSPTPIGVSPQCGDTPQLEMNISKGIILTQEEKQI